MKSLLVALGAAFGIALAACGGRVVVDGVSSGAGGQGGQSGTSSVFSATASVTTGSFTTAASSSSKATSGGGCASCSDVLTGIAKPAELCGVEPVGLFKDLDDCACGKICAKACGNNFCVSFNITASSPECGNCLKDSSTGCGFELLNCANH